MKIFLKVISVVTSLSFCLPSLSDIANVGKDKENDISLQSTQNQEDFSKSIADDSSELKNSSEMSEDLYKDLFGREEDQKQRVTQNISQKQNEESNKPVSNTKQKSTQKPDSTLPSLPIINVDNQPLESDLPELNKKKTTESKKITNTDYLPPTKEMISNESNSSLPVLGNKSVEITKLPEPEPEVKKKNSFFDLFKPQAPVAPAELPMLNTSAKVNPEDLIPKTEPLVLEKKEIISKNKEVDMDVSNWEDLDKYKSSHKDWPYYDTPPSSIYRKKYNQENTHLPEAVFLKDYKKQLLYCIATNDIPGMRALIEKLRIIMNAESKTDALYAVNTVSGDSLLMFAVKQQKLDAVRFLLAEGSDPHQPNNEGITPLDIAIKDRRTDIINAITEYGSYESKPITESESDLALWAKRRKQLKGIDDGESYESSYIYTEESSSENNSTSSSSSSDEFYGGPCKPKK